MFLNNLYCFIHLVYFCFYFLSWIVFSMILFSMLSSFYITLRLSYRNCIITYIMHNVTINIFYNSLRLNYFTKYFQKYFKIITVKNTLYVINKNASILSIDITKNYDKTRYLLTFKITLNIWWYYTEYLIITLSYTIVIKRVFLRLQCISNNN